MIGVVVVNVVVIVAMWALDVHYFASFLTNNCKKAFLLISIAYD